MANVDAALEYLKRGWPVIPGHNPMENGLCSCLRLNCDKPGKHPRVQWREFETKLPAEHQIRGWWRRWPDASVIVLTGELSGLLVVDIDPRSGGHESVHDLTIPQTVTVLTGGGGEHYWFRYPTGAAITIGANALPGIDWRGQGGYVVAPPSLHSSGRRYEWEPGFGPDEHAFAELPAELVKLFSSTPAPSKLGASPSHGEIDITAYAIGMVRLQVGERNNMMARIAGHLLGINTPKPAALATLWAIAQQAETDDQHPAVTLQEVQATLDSIARSESRKRAAQAEIEDATLPDRLETYPAGDVLELARAAWDSVGVTGVVDWIKLVSLEGVEYELEMADRVVPLGSALLASQMRIRDLLLNATGRLMPKLKGEEWESRATLLARTAREVQGSALRPSDRVQEWVDELMPIAQVSEQPGDRRHLLATGPVLLDNRIAMRTARFLRWIESNSGEKLTNRQLGKALSAAGWKYQSVAIGETGVNATMKVWMSQPVG